MLDLIYLELFDMIKLKNGFGADALVMPYLSTVLEHEREQQKVKLFEVFEGNFVAKGKVHEDILTKNLQV